MWTGAKPATGLQAAARAMRYDVIADHMQQHGWQVLATGHTQDDQAETVLMRLVTGTEIWSKGLWLSSS